MGERDPGSRTGKSSMTKWERVDEVASRYPSIGNLTGNDLDLPAMGALLRGILMADMGIKARGGSQGSDRLGVNWPKEFDEAAAMAAYKDLKDRLLTAAMCIRWDRSRESGSLGAKPLK